MKARRLLQSICLLASAILIVLLQTNANLRFVDWPRSSSFRLRHRHASSLTALLSSRPTIAPGELPGYTGWARPERTSAGHFDIVGCSSCASSLLFSFGDLLDHQPQFVAVAGQEFYIDVRCSHPDCSHHGISSEFYLRAYGPSVITGIAKKLDNGDDDNGTSYRLSYYPIDAGPYTIEAIIAFTNPPLMEALPLNGDDGEEEPGYEGYLLRGFPLQLEVLPSTESKGDDNLPLCTINQLPVQANSMQAAADILTKGRWVVTEKTRESNYIAHTPDSSHAALKGYQAGYNALGVMMEYQPVGCRMVDLSWYDNLDHWFDGGQKSNIHLIFVGDSVMGLQHRAILSAMQQSMAGGARISATIIGTHGGLAKRLDAVVEELQMILDEDPDERRFVLFNAGLHDVAQLCSVKYKHARSEYLGLADDEFSCVELYKTLLRELTTFLVSYPAEFVAFQTTSAGWMPYGNFGFAWNPNQYQPYSLSPNVVAHFNEAAKETVDDASDGTFFVVDGYYITLARPDHREIGEDNAIGKHMVHPGIEVVDAMAKIWLTALLSVLEE
mmetsp:Transcript_28003/g.80943  ORF Transcript_28003/g.80943 Transcript_28003/m.80943 type:complete len:556 (-) Transcript_28003:33-1700(-)